MKIELNVVCGQTQVRAQINATAKQHLNDLLHDAGIDYTNRPGSYIDIYIDDNTNVLTQIVRWLNNAS